MALKLLGTAALRNKLIVSRSQRADWHLPEPVLYGWTEGSFRVGPFGGYGRHLSRERLRNSHRVVRAAVVRDREACHPGSNKSHRLAWVIPSEDNQARRDVRV